MALIKKGIASIFTELRDTLQDQQQSRWSEQELSRYLDQAVRNVAISTKYNKITQNFSVDETNTTFTLAQEVIDFHSIDAVQSHVIEDARTVSFPDGKIEEVTVDYYAYPDRIVYGNTTELELEEDIYDMIRFYMLYRAYQKEASTENVKKAQYFYSEYQREVSQNATRWHSKIDVSTSRTDFF